MSAFFGHEPTFRPAPRAVKRQVSEPPARPEPSRSLLERHLEGWQLGAVVVAMALGGALVAVPRPAVPVELPLPSIDRRSLRLEAQKEQELADAAEREPLPFDVRAVGESMRRLGAAAAAGDADAAAFAKDELIERVTVARARHGDDALLRLRALQARLFQKALARWEATGQRGAELDELGGGFIEKARRNGWVRAPHRLVPDPAERATLFLVRWAQLADLVKVHPFSPSLDRWRLYYRFLLLHPEGEPGSADDAERLRSQGAALHALELRDAEYHSALAHAVLEYRSGNLQLAEHALRVHLERHPGGRNALRARNYLAETLEREANAEATP